MDKKVGRPTSEKPKDIIVKTRIDIETVEKLDTYCVQNNTNRSEVIRDGINIILAKK